MDYRILGKTGLTVSQLSLGGAAFGQQYGPISLQDAQETVHAALDAGINFIDTSAYYGLGRSEEILGEILAQGLRDRFILCTKAGRLDRDRFDFSPAGMRACFEGSLQRLRTDHVEILLAHDIEFADDYERVFDETAAVLHDLKREGKCRFIGMSGYPLGLLRQAIEHCHLDVVISYCHFNLQNDRLLTELLPVAESHGVGVLNASPLAMGLLTPQGPPPWHPASETIKQLCKAAADYCHSLGQNIATLGMQFCYAEPRIPSTITGTAKRTELETNLEALKSPPDSTLLVAVQQILAPIHNQTWPSGRYRE
jgi:L-galactose dehydrogenase